jgi:hypothetical protein
MRTVLSENLPPQNLKRSSRDGPNKSITIIYRLLSLVPSFPDQYTNGKPFK